MNRAERRAAARQKRRQVPQHMQALKGSEEWGETCAAIARNDKPKVAGTTYDGAAPYVLK